MADWLLIVPAAYQLLAIVACLAFLRRRGAKTDFYPPISVLKPSNKGTYPPQKALESHRSQDYPEFEIVANDAPGEPTPNPKVGKLMILAREARYPIWIVNDADIRVPPGYLRDVAAMLSQPGVGVVTCLYRATGNSQASSFESLGVAVDFMPSVLVARLIGVREFGLGATLAFRKTDLERIGGFPAIASYLADDYQLAKKITELGLRCELSRAVVDTDLGGGWWAVWRHQVRWARTIRFAKPSGFIGLPVAHAGVWCLVFAGSPWALALLGLRGAAAYLAGVKVLASPVARRWWWLAPVWDVAAFAVWIAGWTGRTVDWQGKTFEIGRDIK
jgi:ceramide glucosyltransferase